MAQQSVQCNICFQKFDTKDKHHLHYAEFQSQAQQILIRYQRLQQEMLSELTQCLSHRTPNRQIKRKLSDKDTSDTSEVEGDRAKTGREGTVSCPECQKEFNGMKVLRRHYNIRMDFLLPDF
ncbi:hypothetical protein N7540_012494 [Penicillium herquei]|nr:hypothetical protein N7540_012494 [Penicillium herquei]